MRLESMHRAAFAFVIVALLFAVSSIFPVHVRGQGETPNPPNIIRRGTAQVQIDANRNVNLIPGPDGTIQIFASTITPPVSPPGKARLYLDTIAGVIRISINGGVYVNLTNPGTGVGTVQNVGLSLPSIFNVTGSPITTNGTLAATFNNQAANRFLRSPTSGAPGTLFVGALVPADIPVLDASILGSGTLGTNRGGLGNPGPYTFGDFLYYGTTGFVRLPGNTTTTRKFLASTGDGVFTQIPNFFQIVSSDLPAINLAGGNVNGGVFGVTPSVNGGTGLATLGAGNSLFGVNATGSAYEFKTPIAGNNLSITHTAGGIRFDVSAIISSSTRAPDGSATVPSFSFTSETNSGLYKFGAGDLRMSILGLDAARFFSGGIAANLTGNVTGTASGNELPLIFSNLFTRTGNTISVTGVLPNANTTATNLNTASTIVARDASGNFSAGNIIGALTGSASGNLPLTGGTLTGNLEIRKVASNMPVVLQLSDPTMPTKLSLQNLINSFQLSVNALYQDVWYKDDITRPSWNMYADADTPTGAFVLRHGTPVTGNPYPIAWTNFFTIASNGNATFSNNVAAPTVTASLTGNVTGTASGNELPLIFSNLFTRTGNTISVTGVLPNANTTATNLNTASTIVARDASGNFAAGNITATTISPIYDQTGTLQANAHTVIGQALLDNTGANTRGLSNAAAFTSATSYHCTFTYTNGGVAGTAAINYSRTSGTIFSLTGTPSAYVSFICGGN